VRKTEFSRKTRETEVSVTLDPDSPDRGKNRIDTGLPFFDHLLQAMAFHGRLGLQLSGKGDLEVDPHHLVEDAGLVLGETLARLVREHGEVRRFGHAVIPMDEALAEVAVDVCGRPTLVYRADFPQPRAGSFDLALVREFLLGLAGRAGISLHALVRGGENAHHMAEALFKALGRALQQAYAPDAEARGMSTKGTIS
jgi:imidazoleglycerol-phosphate dehydratase